MTAAQFQSEVSRRVSEEMKKLEDETRRQKEAAEAERRAAVAATAAAIAAFTPTPAPTEVIVAAPEPTHTPPPTATPAPAKEIPPTILKVVKPAYPSVALKARIGGLVILRVLVSETGQPLEIEVVRPGNAGLTEAAISAVRRWTFNPARKGDVPVRAWTTVPIPFEP
jgi:protein TonB